MHLNYKSYKVWIDFRILFGVTVDKILNTTPEWSSEESRLILGDTNSRLTS